MFPEIDYSKYHFHHIVQYRSRLIRKWIESLDVYDFGDPYWFPEIKGRVECDLITDGVHPSPDSLRILFSGRNT